jgi:acetolactate synthase I/II/III large subunit
MGFGIAAPIALSLAAENAPVLAVVGDGGLTMYLGELETAVRHRARVLYVVFCDASLALIESAQRRRRYPLYGMRFEVPNFAEIGRAFGMPAWHVTSEEELIAAVSAFRNGDGPALVSVPVDPREYDQQAS